MHLYAVHYNPKIQGLFWQISCSHVKGCPFKTGHINKHLMCLLSEASDKKIVTSNNMFKINSN